jgi:7-cyano-7-deazaguanine synthase
MTLSLEFLDKFPSSGGAVVILSGGMDSAIAALLATIKLGKDETHALTFYYKQKQSIEIEKAKEVARYLGIEERHSQIDISFLGDITQRVSANIQGGLKMPTIQEILGHPQPLTVVSNRNAILLMIAASYAEANGLSSIVTGLQMQDQYAYYDTTPRFVNAVNAVLSQNRMFQVQVVAPFLETNKATEILLCQELLGSLELLSHTITCYNPEGDKSCGRCPSCSERIANFKKVGFVDPISYKIDIEW